jgi:hypothetical protein
MAYSAADQKALLAEAQRRVAAADGGDTSTLATQRQTAEKYYRGDPFGNEVKGRSQVVSRDVAQYVDSQMPSLMRIFASGDEVVVFEPTQQSDEEAARQATDYVNWIWRNNEGFVRFHHWFKDGLLFKLGVVKIWWDDSPTHTRERYRDLTDAQLEAMQSDPDLEVGEVTSRPEIGPGPDGQPAVVMLHDIDVVKTERSGRVRVANVPPEEFVFGRRTKDDTDSDVFGHVTKKRKADLIADGFDPDDVNGLATGSDTDNDAAKTVRFRDVDDTGTSEDESEVEVVEAYFRHALADDEPARYWQVTYSGATVLSCEEVDDHPFACVTPILMPHRLVGMSTADQVMDIQLTKSVIWRQMLDNLYLTNAPQIGAVEGQVNLDDLLTRRPGGVVRMKQPGMLTPIPTTPLGGEPYQMIEYLDAQGEQRTGSTRYNQGLDANSLNKTASGINMIQNAAAQRLELIARVYAETGVKRAFKRILGLVQRHQTKPQVIRLRGTWVEMDPRTWSNQMDLTVTVGLGNGNKDQTLAHIMTLLQLDQTIVAMQGGVNGPLLTADGIYAKLKKLIEAAGLRSVESYYSDPSSPEMQQAMAQKQQAQQQQQDPKMIEMQAKMQIEQMQAQARLATDKAAAEQDMALAQQKAQLDVQLALSKAQIDGQIQLEKAKMQAELMAQKAALDVAEMEAQAEADRRAQQFDLIHGAIRRHAELMLSDQQQRERRAMERDAAERDAAERAAMTPEEPDMPAGPSPEYQAMVAMMGEMADVVKSLAATTAELQRTQADMVPLIKRAGAPKRAIRDEAGKIVGSEPVE